MRYYNMLFPHILRIGVLVPHIIRIGVLVITLTPPTPPPHSRLPPPASLLPLRRDTTREDTTRQDTMIQDIQFKLEWNARVVIRVECGCVPWQCQWTPAHTHPRQSHPRAAFAYLSNLSLLDISA